MSLHSCLCDLKLFNVSGSSVTEINDHIAAVVYL